MKHQIVYNILGRWKNGSAPVVWLCQAHELGGLMANKNAKLPTPLHKIDCEGCKAARRDDGSWPREGAK